VYCFYSKFLQPWHFWRNNVTRIWQSAVNWCRFFEFVIKEWPNCFFVYFGILQKWHNIELGSWTRISLQGSGSFLVKSRIPDPWKRCGDFQP
jgi:hypothetical protein